MKPCFIVWAPFVMWQLNWWLWCPVMNTGDPWVKLRSLAPIPLIAGMGFLPKWVWVKGILWVYKPVDPLLMCISSYVCYKY